MEIKKKHGYNGSFENGYARVLLNGKWGMIDETGKEVIECKYYYIYGFKNGFFNALLNDDNFWVNKNGIKIKIIKL